MRSATYLLMQENSLAVVSAAPGSSESSRSQAAVLSSDFARVVAKRLLLAVPLLFIVSALAFVLTSLLPGNAATAVLGPNATPQEIAALSASLHLNQSLVSQYWSWLSQALQGNLGSSIVSGQTVETEIGQHLGVTLSLLVLGTLISVLIGVPLGVWGAARRGRSGAFIDLFSTLGLAIPSFWLALVLVSVFAIKLHLFPANGYASASPGDWLRSLLLPALTLAAVGVTSVAKQTRDGVLDSLAQDYIVNLRAAGLSERRLLWRHALRNAAPQIVTITGLFAIGLLGATVLVEQVFVLPGLGGLATSSAQAHDLPTLQGVVITFTLLVIAINLVSDLLVAWLSPKSVAVKHG
jgi:peptide/nickel transport system permease protein